MGAAASANGLTRLGVNPIADGDIVGVTPSFTGGFKVASIAESVAVTTFRSGPGATTPSTDSFVTPSPLAVVVGTGSSIGAFSNSCF